MPFLMFTTCETRQSETMAINFSASAAETPRCSERNLMVCVLACAQALFISWSNPIVIHDFGVSMRGKSSGLPLTTSTVMLSSL